MVSYRFSYYFFGRFYANTFTPSIVPTGSPQNLTGSSPNSTAIFLSWEAPPPREQNGIIRQYWINVTEVITGRFWQTYSTTTTKELSSLHPYYEYQCVVAAYTIGVGPYSDVITVITAEDGNFFLNHQYS